jgi:hypothetical protein
MKKLIMMMLTTVMLFCLSACSMISEEHVKLRDLDFTVLSEEKIPQELCTIIEEKEGGAFRLTYSDKEFLYICIGYGEQPTGGFSIAVNEFYLTDDAIYINTELLGPEASEKGNKVPSYPYIVIKTEYLDEPVIFQ